MVLGQHQRAVGVFSTQREAERALGELRNAGFPMRQVSIIAQNVEGRDNFSGADIRTEEGNRAGEGAATGAVTGGVVGGLVGLIGSLTALTVPGFGPLVAGGALASTLTGGVVGAAAGGLVGALVGLGIPEDKAKMYSDRVSRGEYLVVVDGTSEEIRLAESLLNRHGIHNWGIFPASDTTRRNDDAMATTPRRDYDDRDPNLTRRHKRAVGVFPTRNATYNALESLRSASFNMERVSVITRDAKHEDDIAGVDVQDKVGNKADEGAAAGALTGGALGGVAGLLVGLGTLAIPGIGPILLAGAEATAIASTLAGAGIGAAAGGLIGALVGLGIPEERAKVYNDRVSRGEYLVMVSGTEDEIRHAEAILNQGGVQELGIYDAPDDLRDRTTPRSVNPTTRTNDLQYVDPNLR
ncbi:MAG: histidine kinase [Desertifilum sp. SIO1I2]|nr:histidine kinase [Desertifilum sp. SIO1I2]